MHWKLKASIQQAIAALPDPLSHALYYRVQRNLGGFRRIDPRVRLRAGLDAWQRIQALGRSPAGKTFFELGTGRVPLVPLAYWLMGAEQVITLDLHPYLQWELVREHLRYIRDHEAEIAQLFGPLLRADRFHSLLQMVSDSRLSPRDFFQHCRIRYQAPGDGTATGLPDGSIDFYTSYTVLEHIPDRTIRAIFQEGNRILRQDGLFAHMIDYGDHFAYFDRKISALNFLQYGEREWARYAGNRFMYMNRLRHDDFLALFASAGQEILSVTPFRDARAQHLLAQDAIPLHERFRRKPREILAITGAWILAAPPQSEKARSMAEKSKAFR